MIFKIRTSKKTMNIFEEIAASTNYPPFILSKLSTDREKFASLNQR